MSVDIREYEVFKKARNLLFEIYKITAAFPKAELYGVTSQLRRSMLSVPTNLVEGARRNSPKDFLRFIEIAHASCDEARFLFEVAIELDYVNDDPERVLCQFEEISKMLKGLDSSIRKSHGINL